jgi:hypothetical protein
MVVTNVVLSQLIEKKDVARARISQRAFFTRVARTYCPLMTSSGLCTRVCANCKPALLGALDGILPIVRSPEAVITWRLRGAVAIQKEKRSAGEKTPMVKKDAHGIRITDSGVSQLEAMFAL